MALEWEVGIIFKIEMSLVSAGVFQGDWILKECKIHIYGTRTREGDENKTEIPNIFNVLICLNF